MDTYAAWICAVFPKKSHYLQKPNLIDHYRKLAAIAAFEIAGLSLAVAFLAHVEPAFFSLPSHNSSASVSIQEITPGGARGWTADTTISVEYKDKVEAGTPAEVKVLVSQKFGPIGQAQPVKALMRPLEITLTIEGTKETKTVEPGSVLPVQLIWAPVLSEKTKEAAAILSVKNLPWPPGRSPMLAPNPDIHVSINGQQSVVHVSDDIRLPVTIYKFYMSARRWEFVSLIASITGFVLGCTLLTKAFSNFLARLLGWRPEDYT